MSGKEFDFFISYANADREWAEGVLVDALRAAQLKCLTPLNFEAGKPRLQAFEEAITSSRQILLVLSPAYMTDDLARFSDQLAQYYGTELGTWPVLPILYKSVEDLPLRIRMLNPLESTRAEEWDHVIQVLAGQRALPQPAMPPPPYRGLRAFGEEDSMFFYGRERETQDALRLLRTYPFLGLIGPSGSGKSSLVYAGVVPSLRRSSSFGPGEWLVLPMRPGEHPLETLSMRLGGDPFQLETSIPRLLAEAKAARLLLVVDQFEELFTVSKDNTVAFQEALLHLAHHEKVFVLMTVRADFYPELMSTSLWPEIQRHRYEIPPLDEAAMADAVRKPAEKVGVYVESALVERLVSDAKGEPGVMPFVQETMILLWDKVVRRFLPLSAYEALVLPNDEHNQGTEATTGLEAAITLHAEAVLSRLDERQRAIARRVFIRLVQFGEGRPDTRRQQPQTALQANDDPVLFQTTLGYLADSRSRLLSLSGEEGATPKVDISHEALITAHTSIRSWIEEGRADELFRRDLHSDAVQWARANDKTAYLYEGARLRQAEDWAGRFHKEINPQVREFLQTSVYQDRSRRRQRQLFLVLLGLFAIFGIASAGFFIREEMLKQEAHGPMISFPAGPALLGYGETRTEVDVPAFRLDQFEVSNRQYNLCVTADRCTPANIPYEEGQEPPGDDLPVTWVTAFQAADFCQWIGRRLPTVVEWERAVRGSEGRTWPWGEKDPFDPQPRVHILPDALEVGGPVGVSDPDFAGGTSLDGQIWQLIGNVAEWTSNYASDNTCPNPYRRDCRIWDGKFSEVQVLYVVGLGWADDLLFDGTELISDFLVSAVPVIPDLATGFRCADSQAWQFERR